MMPAEMLRFTAERMQQQHGPEHERHEFWHALAGLLDEAAGRIEDDSEFGARALINHALTVARAYLGEPQPEAGRM